MKLYHFFRAAIIAIVFITLGFSIVYLIANTGKEKPIVKTYSVNVLTKDIVSLDVECTSYKYTITDEAAFLENNKDKLLADPYRHALEVRAQHVIKTFYNSYNLENIPSISAFNDSLNLYYNTDEFTIIIDTLYSNMSNIDIQRDFSHIIQ